MCVLLRCAVLPLQQDSGFQLPTFTGETWIGVPTKLKTTMPKGWMLSAQSWEVCLSGIDLVHSSLFFGHHSSLWPTEVVVSKWETALSASRMRSFFGWHGVFPWFLQASIPKSSCNPDKRWRLRFKCTVILESHCTGIFQELGKGQWTMNPNENQRPAATNPECNLWLSS